MIKLPRGHALRALGYVFEVVIAISDVRLFTLQDGNENENDTL